MTKKNEEKEVRQGGKEKRPYLFSMCLCFSEDVFTLFYCNSNELQTLNLIRVQDNKKKTHDPTETNNNDTSNKCVNIHVE